jgi:hypothetical protein
MSEVQAGQGGFNPLSPDQVLAQEAIPGLQYFHNFTQPIEGSDGYD